MKKINISNEVLRMCKHLKPLTIEQLQYARQIFPKEGFYKRNGEVWCQCCGHIEKQLPGSLEIDIETGYQCSCGENLKLAYERKKTFNSESKYYSIVQTYKGWQVIRTFYVVRINRKYVYTDYMVHEVYQNWISPEGKEVILGKAYSRSPYHFSWKYDSEFKVRQHNSSASGYYAFDDVFDVRGNEFFPRFNITKKLRKYGWCKSIEKLPYVSMADCMKMLLTSNHAETAVKQSQFDVFLWMVRNSRSELEYMPQLNICHRNKYIITDASIYFDMLSSLQEVGKDIRNPKYICPMDIYKAHDIAVAASLKLRRKKEKEQQMLQAAKDNKKYIEDKQKFFGIVITDGELSIEVLKSVQEFIDEGNTMHHCVFENEYYKKKDSLILSAKVDGIRKETIEVSLKTFSVVQSRAAFNKNSEYHNRIVELVNRNMNVIRGCVWKS